MHPVRKKQLLPVITWRTYLLPNTIVDIEGRYLISDSSAHKFVSPPTDPILIFCHNLSPSHQSSTTFRSDRKAQPTRALPMKKPLGLIGQSEKSRIRLFPEGRDLAYHPFF
jgi:hypothetical protein